MNDVEEIVFDYCPRTWQAPLHLERTRFTTLVVHRRAGNKADAEAFKSKLECEIRAELLDGDIRNLHPIVGRIWNGNVKTATAGKLLQTTSSKDRGVGYAPVINDEIMAA